jgi:LacI family transcriptional regulator
MAATPKVTQADVARAAGTSMAVVSYVVNGGPRPVAEATRRRVLEAIRSTGYRPNGVARALAAGATHTFGLVIPDIANEFFAELAFAVEQAARKSGRTVLLANSEGDAETEFDLLETFLQRQIDGVVLASQAPDAAQSMLTESRTAGVFLGAAPKRVAATSIAVDNAGGAYLATSHLAGHGCERIAIISGPAGDEVADARRAGWQQALAEHGGTGAHVEQPFTVDGGHTAALELLDVADRPQAVFAASDRQAIGLLRAAADLGLSIPGDLAIVTFDGSAASAYAVPSLTTIQQPIAEMAELAVRLLLSGEDTAPTSHLLDVGLVVRRSCGCPPDRP